MFNLFKITTQEEFSFKSVDLPKYYFDTFIEERTPNLIQEASRLHKIEYPSGPKIFKTTIPDKQLSVSERMLHVENEIKKHFNYGK